MTRDQFINSRQDAWKRFTTLVQRASNHRISTLSGEEISELSALYRSICFDLSLVQSRDWGTSMNRYLNGLVAEGHNCLYRSQPGSIGTIVRFFTVEFPQRLRANWQYFLVASLLFIVPGAICGIVVAIDPSQTSRILSGEHQRMFESMYSQSVSERESGMETAMAGFYVWNNVGISFRCFALGAFAGIGTMIVLVTNSIFLGTVTGFMISHGNAKHFSEFVVGHGAFELTAIAISGAAGLMIGHSIVHPGKLTRWDALRTRGLDAVKIAMGAGAMLCVAALIEAYWSPSPVSFEIKMAVGAFLWMIVAAYLMFAGRSRVTSSKAAASEVITGGAT